MFGPWIATWAWIKRSIPRKFHFPRRRFNFITLHYIYMISMTIIGSILLYAAGGLRYIDALFFASGSVTQSGLNTVDVNKLKLYQQVILMMITCMCTPIFINTFVVFVRLYWFEKRFQHVVREARNLRKTKSRSISRSQAKEDRDMDREERGVAGREIRVLRAENGHAHGRPLPNATDIPSHADGTEEKRMSSENSASPSEADEHQEGEAKSELVSEYPSFRRDIMFADEVGDAPVRLPERRTTDQHIAFVQNQRNPKDKGTFRIPGPRDYDRGEVPRRLEEGEELNRVISGDGPAESEAGAGRGHRGSMEEPMEEMNADDHPVKHSITFDEPDHPRMRNRISSAFTLHRKNSEDNERMTLRQRARTKTLASFMTARSQERDPMPYLSWQPTIGRNSAFIDLSEEQREELGGIEYRALKTLAFILVLYYVGFHLFGMLCLLPWVVRDKRYSDIVQSDGVSSVWWGFFTPASMFNDLGFTLTPDSMISFQRAVFPLLIGAFLIIIGNTGFPCMLRFIIWFTEKFVPVGSGLWEELRFLLDHPRRCFTLLFPGDATWWLFWVLVLLNVTDLVFFIILDLKDSTVTDMPAGIRVLVGFFQAASTRTAGFAAVNLADLHPATQVSYMIMMYISVFPVAISLRRTNVYEERSLGVYADDDDEENNHSYVGTHLRRQLSFDLWYVFLGFFLISIIEGGRLQDSNEDSFTLFAVLFEIVSAYGTVGLSLGYPGINASFSAEFSTLSKLIVIAMQLRGRHRGLPYALDRAILLPSESLHKKEEEDALRRTNRRLSTVSEVDPVELLHRQRSRETSSVGVGGDGHAGLPPRAETFRRPSFPPPGGVGSTTDVRLAQQHHGTAGGGGAGRRLSRVLSGFANAGPTGGGGGVKERRA